MRMGPEDRVLVTLPLFHVAAQNVLMNGAFGGAAVLVLHRRFDVERCAEAVEAHRVTVMTGVPTIYIALLNAGIRPAALAASASSVGGRHGAGRDRPAARHVRADHRRATG
jgi:acyl-CoA synthetase (AMP-forming)/AMP-acid ligase II